MSRVPRVQQWAEAYLADEFDLFVVAVGFEQRARFIAETVQPRAGRYEACAFPDRQVHDFHKNREVLDRLGYQIEQQEDTRYQAWCRKIVRGVATTERQIHIGVDISSFSRFRIAALIDEIRRAHPTKTVTVDFVYALALFSPPPDEMTPNQHVGPVLDSFAGWSDEPDQPPVAILGLGYEEDRALGAVEHLQTSEIFAFIPSSDIPGYHQALLEANAALMERIPEHRRISYTVEKPLECFIFLEGLTYGCAQTRAPILLPFGPKIFSVAALLVACIHQSVSVWRVSPGAAEAAQNRLASGSICGLRAVFPPVPEPG